MVSLGLSSLLPRQAAGLQGSERTTVKIVVYDREGSSFSLYEGNQTIDFDGRVADGVPPVLDCQVSNSLSAGGTFSFTLFVEEGFDACATIGLDAWVDISFCRGGTCWHVMRGMVDEVHQDRVVASSGATQITARVQGRSHQKAWETTRSFFSQLNASNYFGASLFRATQTGQVNYSPTRNVQLVLFKFFDLLGSLGTANWALPSAMPGATGNVSQAVLYDDDYFDKTTLARATPTGNLLFPDASLWDLCSQQFAELQFCELFTEILPATGYRGLSYLPTLPSGLAPADSRMAVVFRDKPFPRVDPLGLGKLGRASPYFSLPLWSVPRQATTSLSVGTNTLEIKNLFTCVGNFFSESLAGFAGLKSPLYRADDRKRRGTRSLDGVSPYEPNLLAGVSRFALFQARRARLRDWYCMGEELRSMTVTLWRAYPELRLGGRFRVLGASPDQDLTGYLESYRHAWTPRFAQTQVDCTRGWIGTDDQLIARLTRLSSAYRVGSGLKPLT